MSVRLKRLTPLSDNSWWLWARFNRRASSLGREASVMITLSDRSSSYNVDLAVNSEPWRVKQNVTFSLSNDITPLGFILTAIVYQAGENYNILS